MSEHYQKVKKIILASELSLTDQTALIEALARAGTAELEQVCALFEQDPSWVRPVSENFRAKRAVFATGNPGLWNRILREEESQLGKIAG